MLIFCEHINPRVNYIFDFVIKTRLGLTYNITQSVEEFNVYEGPKINYSNNDFENSLKVTPIGLLFENTIKNTKPVAQKMGERFVMFPSPGELGFDIFSAIFWFISRYEEYQQFTPDKFNRFPANESFAYQRNVLHQRIVDEWIMELKNVMKKKYATLAFADESYSIIPTIDVDSPWCYRNKGFKRNLGGLARDYWKANFKEVLLRLLVLFRLKADPWYQFSWLQNVFDTLNLNPLYFVHVGNHGKYDKTVTHTRPQFRKFVTWLKDKAQVGIHPSYEAGKSMPVFEEEIGRLQQLTGNSELISRQHYLTIRLPYYYQSLEEMGIQNDYSMGFADIPGFRAGTSRPFKFYDLSKEKATELTIHPFCIMDRTLKSYQNLSLQAIERVYNDFALSLKKVNGQFVTLWHNETFSEHFEWKGWKKLFVKIQEQATSS